MIRVRLCIPFTNSRFDSSSGFFKQLDKARYQAVDSIMQSASPDGTGRTGVVKSSSIDNASESSSSVVLGEGIGDEGEVHGHGVAEVLGGASPGPDGTAPESRIPFIAQTPVTQKKRRGNNKGKLQRRGERKDKLLDQDSGLCEQTRDRFRL